jgi:hypothetical protein
MRDPVGAIVPGAAVTIITGNQFQGGGNPGNQLQDGSTLFFRRQGDADWTALPLTFHVVRDNNKYFAATIPADTFQTGDTVQYYLRIAYDDHDTTFLQAAGEASTTTDDEAAARAAPFTFTVESSAVYGQWGPVFPMPNVGIHSSVLPNGTVLMWGRRDRPGDTLDEHQCTPFVWDPRTGSFTDTPQPTQADGTTVNLFCAGHAFLPDGRLLVAGGHWVDGDGLNQACIYDWRTNRWEPTDPMTASGGQPLGRWYPTLTALPNGNVLVLSGSYAAGREPVNVDLLQVWENGTWRPIPKADGVPLNYIGLPLYPRMHVGSDGRLLMPGPLDRCYLLKTSAPGEWVEIARREMGTREYAPSVMYDTDKVIYIGGGGGNQVLPAREAEVMDLGQTPLAWRMTAPMNFHRRQHNAVILPDGTVLVTGGTRGVGGPNDGFNDLSAGAPVHTAELWDPATEQWTVLSAEAVDRCYHGTAVLLPDATVLSAGSGEYRPDSVNPNDPDDSHRDAQVFSPPYLFRGPRPEITSAPDSVAYGDRFTVATPRPDEVGRVSWVRLPSVTHSFDQNQRINFLQFTAGAGELAVSAPASANACPPGHYMLFLLSRQGVPSIAHVVQVQAPVPAPAAPGEVQPAAALAAVKPAGAPAVVQAKLARLTSKVGEALQVYEHERYVDENASGTRVTVGVTGTCPYGIGACWGGAYAALKRLQGVQFVRPIPNAKDSTADLYMDGDRLPPVEEWDQQFQDMVHGAYVLRGVEVELRGPLDAQGDLLFMAAAGQRIQLVPLAPEDKVQWDHTARAPRPLQPGEASAYEQLASAPRDGDVTVTGPLRQTDAGYRLEVRLFQH